jgi:hypothetical protein
MGAAGIEKQRAEIAVKKKAYDQQMAKNRRSPFGRTVVPEGAETPKGVGAESKTSEEKGHEGHNHDGHNHDGHDH